MSRRRTTFIICLLLIVYITGIIHAQTPSQTVADDNPTVTALAEAVVPVADAIDLAQRFRGTVL